MSTKRSKIKSMLILLIFLSYVLLLLPGDRGILNQIKLNQQKKQLNKEIQLFEETKKKLEEKKEELQDPETVKQIAREKYGMAKEDEKVYRVVPKEQKNAE